MKAEQLLKQIKAGELKPEEFVEQARALPTAEAEKLLLKYVNGRACSMLVERKATVPAIHKEKDPMPIDVGTLAPGPVLWVTVP